MRLPGDKSPAVSARDGAGVAALILGFLFLAFHAAGESKVAGAIMALVPLALLAYLAFEKKRRASMSRPETKEPGNV